MKTKVLMTVLFTALSFNTFAVGSELSDLKAGKNVIKEVTNDATKVTETQLVFLVKAKPEKVWDILMDCEKYPEFMPVKEYSYKSKHGSYDIVHVQPEAPAMFNVSYDLKRVYNKSDWKISFEKVAGKIKSINGSWKFEPLNSQYTKITYISNVDVGMPLPGFVKDYFTKGSLNKVGDWVKKRIESNGTWKRS